MPDTATQALIGLLALLAVLGGALGQDPPDPE